MRHLSSSRSYALSTLALLLPALMWSCSSDPGGGDTGGEDGDVGVDISRADTAADTTPVDDSGDDEVGDTADDSESLPDGLFCDDDDDHDGHYAVACGGDDCDDAEPRAFPGATEVCDRVDNNCDGSVNEEITCAFYAHTGDGLYTIDPIASPPVATRIADAPSSPSLWDIDTHPDGTLYGVSSESLFRFNTATNAFEVVAPLTGYEGDANGMAIDNEGTAFITSGNSLYTIDLDTAVMTLVGTGDYESSGDCVVDKGGVLYLASRHGGDEGYSNNTLVRLDGMTGEGTDIGPTGFSGVYALTSAWGTLYGLTSNGELIQIDPSSGAAELLHTFPSDTPGEGLRWYGAASSPDR